MTRNTRTYSDLDLNFIANPATGDAPRKYDENAVKQAVKNLILTSNFERPFHSEIGSPIKSLMFEPAGPFLDIILKQSIANTINNFEPRVRLDDVIVRSNPDNNQVMASIIFRIVNTNTPITLDIILRRSR